MAQPIPLEIPPRDPRADLRSRVERAPEEHAEAVLAAYELLQQLHEQGVLDIMRSAVAARDELLEKVVDNAKTPRPCAESGTFFTGGAFLAASSRSGSRASSRQFPRVWRERARTSKNRLASSRCCGD